MVFIALFIVHFLLFLDFSTVQITGLPHRKTNTQEELLANSGIGGNFTEELAEQDRLHNGTNATRRSRPKPQPTPCIEPFFTNALPAAAQKRLKAIWANYDDNDNATLDTDCGPKEAAALKLIQALPKKQRDRAFVNLFTAIYQNSRLNHVGRIVPIARLIEVFYGDVRYRQFLKSQADIDAAVIKFQIEKLKLFSQARRALINDIQEVKEVKALEQNWTTERNVTDLELTNETLSDQGTELLIKELLPLSARKSARKHRCELPPFRKNLGGHERKKIDEIWASYLKGPKGADCTKERRATQKYLYELPAASLALYVNLGDYLSPLGINGR